MTRFKTDEGCQHYSTHINGAVIRLTVSLR
jgi:hypothetical protein